MIHSYIYTGSRQCQQDATLDELRQALASQSGMVWVDFEQPTPDENKYLSEFFNFHPLAIEDCVNVRHHPKIDDYGDYLYMIFHAVHVNEETDRVQTGELDLFLGKNFVVTYHTRPIETIRQMKEKCEKNADLPMSKGCDFFLYVLLDRLMENYEPVVDDLAEEIGWAEEEVFFNADQEFLKTVYRLKKDVIYIRRIISLQRDTILLLAKEDFARVSDRSRLYFKDTYDLLFRIMGTLDSHREQINSIVDAFMIVENNRLNRVMKDLTILSALLLPLSVIVGIYGMNFRVMPELEWKHGYYFVWALMILTVLFQLYIMKRKKYF